MTRRRLLTRSTATPRRVWSPDRRVPRRPEQTLVLLALASGDDGEPDRPQRRDAVPDLRRPGPARRRGGAPEVARRQRARLPGNRAGVHFGLRALRTVAQAGHGANTRRPRQDSNLRPPD